MAKKLYRPADRRLIGIWLRAEDHALVEQAAAAYGHTLAAWCREIALRAAQRYADRLAKKNAQLAE